MIPISYAVSYVLWVIFNFGFVPIVTIHVLANLIITIYYIYLHSVNGQTFGKRIFEVKLVDISESDIKLQQAIFRSLPQLLHLLVIVLIQVSLSSPTNPIHKFFLENIVAGFFILLFFWHIIDIIAVFSNDKRRALHDLIAGTVVIKL